MKFLIALLALTALAQAERDLSKFTPKARHVVPKHPPSAVPKVVGGAETDRHQYPHMAALFIDDMYFCGGSILAQDKILTAGHCCDGARSIEAIVGGHNIRQSESTQQTVNSKLIEGHPDYDPYNIANDVCVVTLSSNIKLDGTTTKAIQLYQGNDSLEGEEAIVSGWGRPSDSSGAISPVLRHASDKVISNKECKESFNIVRDSTICMNGKNGRSACNGDSGGPLTVNGEEVGVVSFGSAWGCAIGFPSAYARVSVFRDWINSKL
ncbi:hypothetical protein ILUMI_20995 [Ignelater luminosus]|uniref:Peptidase S1 domain-containing protein n=1 Tax=Ignelater luminosus TaxID=2038154 RepID=A0A8K0G1U6_IGNLU|nr:hypothetical protein ILUMI_20996 [Ignelater luminosus]KAF2885178.1 hypothetical protein ILUMI_20995 [Ignelater luminosus]